MKRYKRLCRLQGIRGGALVLFCATAIFVFNSDARGYFIQFSDTLDAASFYKTLSVGTPMTRRSQYALSIGKKHTWPFEVGPLADLNNSPTSLSAKNHPIIGQSGKVGKLLTCCTQLSANEGANTGVLEASLGTGTQTFNIGGTFQVKPEMGEAAAGFVPLLGKGIIDGQIGVGLKSLAGAPSASFAASIFIENLGTVSASASSAGTVSETIGVSGTIAKEPGATGSIEKGVQVTTSGTGPQNFFMMGKVPVNVDLVWNFTMTLQAMNTENFAGGRSAAWSFLTEQFVNLTPQSKKHQLKKEDPFFSEAVFRFDANTGELSVLHPERALDGIIQAPTIVNDDGTAGTPNSPDDFSHFLPEVEAIIDANDEFSTTDQLLNSRIKYPTMTYQGTNPDGNFLFNGGPIQFIDPISSSILAEGLLTNVVADPANMEFGAALSGFSLVGLNPGESPLADKFVSSGGALWFDPSIMFDSGLFTTSAVSTPYTVDGSPVPEPSSWKLLLLCGVVLAAWFRIDCRTRPSEPQLSGRRPSDIGYCS